MPIPSQRVRWARLSMASLGVAIVLSHQSAIAAQFVPLDAGGYVRVRNDFRLPSSGRVSEFGTNAILERAFTAERSLVSEPGFLPMFVRARCESWFDLQSVTFLAQTQVRSEIITVVGQVEEPAQTYSNFGVTFRVDQSTPFAIVISMDTDPFGAVPIALDLQGVQGVVTLDRVGVGGSRAQFRMINGELRFYGNLVPGEYSLGFQAWNNDRPNPFFTFDRIVNYRAVFTVPGPSAAVIGLALGVACASRRRRTERAVHPSHVAS